MFWWTSVGLPLFNITHLGVPFEPIKILASLISTLVDVLYVHVHTKSVSGLNQVTRVSREQSVEQDPPIQVLEAHYSTWKAAESGKINIAAFLVRCEKHVTQNQPSC